MTTILTSGLRHSDQLDCVVIGHNELNFASVFEDLKETREHSGAYLDIKANSVNFHGERITYMTLLNRALKKATGIDHNLNVCEMPQLGAAYLKSYLCKRNFNVEVVNSFTQEKDRLIDILRQSPNAVAITTTFYVDHSPIVDIVRFVRRHSPDTRIIVGGPHIFNLCETENAKTLDYIFGTIGADIYIFDSQGEMTLSLILSELRKSRSAELKNIPNITYTRDNKLFERTERAIENNDMDENRINWHYFDRDFYTPTVQIRTARSCAFSCAFCKYPAMAGPLNLTSLDAVESELRMLADAGVKNLVFIDDTFNVPLPRFKQICRLLIKNDFGFDWFSFFRCSNSDDEAFDLMKESGCKGVFLGIESGDEKILKSMNKFANVDRYKYGIRKLKERDIVTFASIIVGYPGETSETVKNTIEFIEEASPMFYRAELYYHYTNVPIQQRAGEFGLRGAGYSWKHNSMDWRKASEMLLMMLQTVKGPTILPGYMFDFWSIPYLLGKGLSIDQIAGFTRIARELLLQSFDETSPDATLQEKQLDALFDARSTAFRRKVDPDSG